MLDRTVPPPFVKSDRFDLPPYQQKNVRGIPVFTVPEVRQDVMKVEIIFPAGKWFEQKAGVSHFASNMLDKGTQRLNSTELAEAFDRLGAHIEISAGYDHTSVAVYALKKNWRESVALLSEMLTTPSFDQDELDLMRDIFLQNLRINKEKTSFVAGQLIRKNIFGNHPYGTSIEETDARAVMRDDLAEFHAQAFKPNAIFITSPPSISIDDIISYFETLVPAPSSAQEHPPAVAGPAREHIAKEGVQTTLRLGRRSLLRTDTSYPDLLLFSHILGGYFGSRLMKNIREEKGLTYGIYSSINPFLHDSFFVIGADVNKENVTLALDEISKEVKRMRTEPVDAEELEIAKNHFLGSLQSEVANPFSVTDKVKNIFLHQLPNNYYPNLFKRIDTLTADDLIAVGEKYVNEESLVVATVG